MEPRSNGSLFSVRPLGWDDGITILGGVDRWQFQLSLNIFLVFLLSLFIFFTFLLRVKLALATTVQFSRCI